MATDKEQLASTIKALLWSIHELETTVCDYDANQDVLQTRMCVHAPLLQQQQHAIFHSNQLVEGLQTLATQRDAVDMQVPMELLRYLDDGGNPDSFTTEVFSRAQADNQQAKGRVDALRKLHDTLAQRLADVAPDVASQLPSRAPDT